MNLSTPKWFMFFLFFFSSFLSTVCLHMFVMTFQRVWWIQLAWTIETIVKKERKQSFVLFLVELHISLEHANANNSKFTHFDFYYQIRSQMWKKSHLFCIFILLLDEFNDVTMWYRMAVLGIWMTISLCDLSWNNNTRGFADVNSCWWWWKGLVFIFIDWIYRSEND